MTMMMKERKHFTSAGISILDSRLILRGSSRLWPIVNRDDYTDKGCEATKKYKEKLCFAGMRKYLKQ
jgi:hypothetical protein